MPDPSVCKKTGEQIVFLVSVLIHDSLGIWRQNKRAGTSYELFAWYAGNTVFLDGTLINTEQRTVNEWLDLHPGDAGYNPANDVLANNPNPTYVPKRLGHFHGMSNTLLVLDSDQDLEQAHINTKPSSNYPDMNNNHGIAGLNMGFADGHVDFIPRGPKVITSYLNSYAATGMLMTFIHDVIPTLNFTAASGTTPGRWTMN